jgi:hypothetical protein
LDFKGGVVTVGVLRGEDEKQRERENCLQLRRGREGDHVAVPLLSLSPSLTLCLYADIVFGSTHTESSTPVNSV